MFEQHAGLGPILGDLGEVMEEQENEAIEPVDAAPSLSWRRVTWSFRTRSVVRVKRSRHPFSIRTRPRAAARWSFPPPRPNRS